MKDERKDTTDGGETGFDGAASWNQLYAWRAAAWAGDGAAACRLGDCFRIGKSVPCKAHTAFLWYVRGAWAGNADAMNKLGACFQRGFGCTKDMASAIHWYRRAAGAGSLVALDNLGCCLLNGTGVAKDLAQAAACFREAHAKGYRHAAGRLARMGLTVDNPDAAGRGSPPAPGTSARGDRGPQGSGGCPRCGSRDVHPSDMDSWWCGGCRREYPTRAFCCKHPGCLESVLFGDYCKQHANPAPVGVDK